MIHLFAPVGVVLLLGVGSAAAALTTSHLTDPQLATILASPEAAVAEGRIGDNGTNATFEFDLSQNTAAPTNTQQYVWPNGQPVPFTLTFDGVNLVTFTIGPDPVNNVSRTATLDLSTTPTPNVPITDLFLRTRASQQGGRTDTSITLDSLVLNSTSVGDVSAATSANINNVTDVLWISGVNLGAGFTLTGRSTMLWTGSPPTQSNLAYQLKCGYQLPHTTTTTSSSTSSTSSTSSSTSSTTSSTSTTETTSTTTSTSSSTTSSSSSSSSTSSTSTTDPGVTTTSTTDPGATTSTTSTTSSSTTSTSSSSSSSTTSSTTSSSTSSSTSSTSTSSSTTSTSSSTSTTVTTLPFLQNSYQCYEVDREPFALSGIALDDRFGAGTVSTRKAWRICNPADLSGQTPSPADHLVAYAINQTTPPPPFPPVNDLLVTDTIDINTVSIYKIDLMLVPSNKSLAGPPPALITPSADHYKCYKVRYGKARVPNIIVSDQFGVLHQDAIKPFRLCVVADKNHEGAIDTVSLDPGAPVAQGFMCYKTRPTRGYPVFRGPGAPVYVSNQFGQSTFEAVHHLRELCVPAAIQAAP